MFFSHHSYPVPSVVYHKTSKSSTLLLEFGTLESPSWSNCVRCYLMTNSLSASVLFADISTLSADLDINVSGPEQLGIYPSELSPWPVFINPIGPGSCDFSPNQPYDANFIFSSHSYTDGRPQYQIVTPNQVVDAASLPHFLSGLLIVLFVILIL